MSAFVSRERARPLASAMFALYRGVGWLVFAGLWVAVRGGLVQGERAVAARERLGRWGRREDGPEGGEKRDAPTIWVHAASVGEVALCRPLLARIRMLRPGSRILLTCNTATGRRLAAQSGADEVRYCPLDAAPVVGRILDVIEPRLYVFVETEIWPLLLTSLAARSIPAALVNARISKRSFPRYRRIRALVAPALRSLALVCARDQGSLERLRALGAPMSRSLLSGDLKFDTLDDASIHATTDRLAPIKGDRPVLLAASTHAGEDEIVADAFMQLPVGLARLVIAPRHPERAAFVAHLLASRGLEVQRWTTFDANGAWQALVVDTVGELLGFMASSAAVFLGGSLVEVGGHNLLEPAGFARPVVTGPHLTNVAAVAAELAEVGALTVVRDASGLAACWRALLADPAAADQAGRRGLAVLAAHRGALARTIDALAPLLPAAP